MDEHEDKDLRMTAEQSEADVEHIFELLHCEQIQVLIHLVCQQATKKIKQSVFSMINIMQIHKFDLTNAIYLTSVIKRI